ncbi:MAG: TetR/AcrR family transcriptional regulator [Spirochaetales bacterium]|jgi:AcrR family transcriptional regulator|nr:TetR/AcrR family transcriptional regulator [Spirochaetales bacterium]
MDYRERITGEAANLFMTYGIRSVTMDSIAHNLGMSKRTIYEHFADKDELLYSVIISMAGKQKKTFRKIMDDSENVIEALFEILHVATKHIRNTNPTYFVDLKKYHYKVFEKICNKGDIRNYEMSLAMLRRGIKEKLFRENINIDIVNAGIHGIINLTSDSEYLPAGKYSRFEILDNLLLNYLIGISTPGGKELINIYKEQRKFE